MYEDIFFYIIFCYIPYIALGKDKRKHAKQCTEGMQLWTKDYILPRTDSDGGLYRKAWFQLFLLFTSHS